MTEIAVNESNAYSERKYVIFLMTDQPLEHFFYEEAAGCPSANMCTDKSYQLK